MIQGIQNSPALPVSQALRTAEAAEPSAAPAAEKQILPAYDEYIPEDRAARQTAGIYRVVPDEDGSPKLHFDGPDGKAETCTTNTDKVDRETEQLKAKKEQLEQRLSAAGDPQKAEEYQKQLAQLERELQQRSTDTYRRQHAVIT